MGIPAAQVDACSGILSMMGFGYFVGWLRVLDTPSSDSIRKLSINNCLLLPSVRGFSSGVFIFQNTPFTIFGLPWQ